MHSAIGLSFAPSKKSLVSSRLSGRIQRLGLDSFINYAAQIESGEDAGEFQMAVDLLTTNETYFFREPKHYELLEQHLVNSHPRQLRVWSAASSVGDEAYSTAMLLADMAQQGRIGSDWSVLGAYISDRVLQSASQGIYPAERLRNVAPERLKRYCLRGEAESDGLVQMQMQMQMQMQDKLRQKVCFGQLNLCTDFDDLGPFDVVFLRNVLIYFDPPTKSAVVDRVLRQLRPGGLFFIGTAEGRVPCQTPLKALSAGAVCKVAL